MEGRRNPIPNGPKTGNSGFGGSRSIFVRWLATPGPVRWSRGAGFQAGCILAVCILLPRRGSGPGAWLVFQRGPGLVRRLSEAGCFGFVFFFFFLWWSPETGNSGCFAVVGRVVCFGPCCVCTHLPTNSVPVLAAVRPGLSTSLVFLPVRVCVICPPLVFLFPPGPSLPLCQLRIGSATALDQRTSS